MSFSVGVADDWLIPGVYKQIEFGQGQSAAGPGERDALITAAMLPTGTGTPFQEYLINAESQIADLAGLGSDAHRMVRACLRENGAKPVYVVLYPESSGVGATTADGYAHFSGTASANGYIKVTFQGEEFVVNVLSGDAAATVVPKFVAMMNGRTHLAATSALTNTSRLTMTAKHKGASKNGTIRFRVENYNTGLTITVSGSTLGTGFGTLGADGATSENSQFQLALDAQVGDRRYHKGYCLNNSTANAAMKSHLITKSSGLVSMSEVAVLASVGTFSAAQAISTGLNFERLQLVCQPNSEHDLPELAGIMLGSRMLFENNDPTKVMDNYTPSGLRPVVGTRPTPTELNNALKDGVTPVSSNSNVPRIVRSVTTRSKDATGLVADQRVADTTIVSGGDFALDMIASRVWLNWGAKKLVDDPKTANGEIDSFALNNMPANKTCPFLVKGTVNGALKVLEDATIIADADAAIAKVNVRLSPTSPTRIEILVPFEVINSAHQITVKALEVGVR